MRILVLYPFLVKPGSLGGVARVTRLLSYLDERGHDVWLACFATDEELASDIPLEAVREHCREMVVLPVEPRSTPSKAVSLLFDPLPTFVAHYDSAAMRAEVRRILDEEDIDVFHVEFTYLGDYVDEATNSSCATVLVDEELNFHARRRLYETSPMSARGMRALWESRRFKRHELDVVTRFDKVLAIVDGERDLLLEHHPELNVDVYPNTVDTTFFAPADSEPTPRRIAFVGNYEHYPNEDGIVWFARAVLPLVREAAPDVTLDVIGANVTSAVRELDDGDTVNVRGYVDDIRPHLAEASVFICPLVNGGGMRGKALEAMAMQLPVVTTPIGVEGIDVDEQHALIASDPQEFADGILRLFSDDAFRRRMGAAGRELVCERYDDSVVFAALEREYEQLAAVAHERRGAAAPAGASADLGEVSGA